MLTRIKKKPDLREEAEAEFKLGQNDFRFSHESIAIFKSAVDKFLEFQESLPNKKFTENDDHRTLAKYFNSLADACFYMGELKVATRNYVKAVKALRQIPRDERENQDMRDLAFYYNSAGDAYRKRNLLDRALKKFTWAIKRIETLPKEKRIFLDYLHILEAHINRAEIFKSQGNLQAMKDELSKADKIDEEAFRKYKGMFYKNYISYFLRYYDLLVDDYILTTKDETILTGYLEFKERFQHLNKLNDDNKASLFATMGVVSEKLARFNQAVEFYAMAIANYKTSMTTKKNNKEVNELNKKIVECAMHAGEAAKAAGDEDNYVLYRRKEIDYMARYSEENRDNRKIANAYADLNDEAYNKAWPDKLWRLEQAVFFQRSAVRHSQDTLVWMELANYLYILGLQCEQANNLKPALDAFNEVIQLIQKHAYREEKFQLFANAHYHAGCVLFLQKKYEEAMECFSSLLGLFYDRELTRSDLQLVSNCHERLARVYQAIEYERKEDHYKEINAAFLNAANAQKKLIDANSSDECNRHLYEIYYAQGEYCREKKHLSVWGCLPDAYTAYHESLVSIAQVSAKQKSDLDWVRHSYQGLMTVFSPGLFHSLFEISDSIFTENNTTYLEEFYKIYNTYSVQQYTQPVALLDSMRVLLKLILSFLAANLLPNGEFKKELIDKLILENFVECFAQMETRCASLQELIATSPSLPVTMAFEVLSLKKDIEVLQKELIEQKDLSRSLVRESYPQTEKSQALTSEVKQGKLPRSSSDVPVVGVAHQGIFSQHSRVNKPLECFLEYNFTSPGLG